MSDVELSEDWASFESVSTVSQRLNELADETNGDDAQCLQYAAKLLLSQSEEWAVHRRLITKHAAEINLRRGSMSVAREALRELGHEGKTFCEMVKDLGRYKLAMESMAAQIRHPKTTADDMVRMQLGE